MNGINNFFWNIVGLVMFITCFITFPDFLNLIFNGMDGSTEEPLNKKNVLIFAISSLGFIAVANMLYGKKK